MLGAIAVSGVHIAALARGVHVGVGALLDLLDRRVVTLQVVMLLTVHL